MDEPFSLEQKQALFDEVWANHNPYGDESVAFCPNDGYRMKAFVYRTEQLKADLSVSCPRCGFERLDCNLDPRADGFREWTDDEKQEMVDWAFQGQPVTCPVDGTRLAADLFGPEVLIHCFRCGNMHSGSVHRRVGSRATLPAPVPVLARPVVLPPIPVRVEAIHMEWDLFISHAHEDKQAVAEPLAHRFKELGVNVWYDSFTLKVGDSLRRSIDQGLAHSTYGLVILSPNFFKKHWPQKELDGLAALETGDNKKILPVWHNVGQKEVAEFSPTLADKLGVSTLHGLENVVEQVMAVVRPSFTFDKKGHIPGNSSTSMVPSPAQTLHPKAVELLREAAKDDGTIMIVDTLDGFHVQVNRKVVNEPGNPRSEALYKKFLRTLQRDGYIIKESPEDYSLTPEGYEVADEAESSSGEGPR